MDAKVKLDNARPATVSIWSKNKNAVKSFIIFGPNFCEFYEI